MTDRIRHLTVVLDKDYRDDDLEGFIKVLKSLRGVAAVVPGEPVNATDYMAREAVATEVRARLHEAIEEVFLRGERRSR